MSNKDVSLLKKYHRNIYEQIIHCEDHINKERKNIYGHFIKTKWLKKRLFHLSSSFKESHRNSTANWNLC